MQQGTAYCPLTRVALLPSDKKITEEMSSAVHRFESRSGGESVLIRNPATGPYEISSFVVVCLSGHCQLAQLRLDLVKLRCSDGTFLQSSCFM